MATDMSLGGGAGFGAGYTPIQFAPLVSLTGPVIAPAAPAAPAESAPAAAPIRYPTIADMPDNAYMTGEIPAYGGASIGNRSGAEIRGDLARIGEFFLSPLGTMASYAATGKMPSEHMQGLIGGTGQAPGGGFNLGDWFAKNVFGREEVPLGGGPGQIDTRAGMVAYGDAVNIASGWGLSDEAANAAGRTAAGLVAQGMNPTAAAAMAANYAAYADRSQMPDGAPTSEGIPKPGLEALNQSILQGTGTMSQFGPQVTGGGFAPSDGGFTGGGWSAGDVSGAYSDSTGFE